jgi:nucleotide-binding universal stress UspA family protein
LEFLVGLKNVIKKLQIIHVVTEKEMEGLGKRGLMKMEKENRIKLDELCEALEGEGIEVESHLYIGDFSQIENAARERDATLIVTGTSGKSSWQARWLGSVSHQVAEVSELPTLLVP